MADVKFNARVEADLSPLSQAASNMAGIFAKFAPKDLKKQYEELGRFIGKALDPQQGLKNVPISGRVKIGSEIAKGMGEAEKTVNSLARSLGGKLGKEFESVNTTANKVKRTTKDLEAKALERTLRNSANEVPKISTALFKVNGVWRQISAEAEGYRKKLKDQGTQVSEVRKRVSDLRKEYDLRVPLATNAAGVKKLGETQARLKRAEAELTKVVTKYSAEQKAPESERNRILGTINNTLTTGLSTLKLTKAEEAKLTTSEKLRLVTQKQITEEQKRQTEIATRQAAIDQARRQAYALTIAGGQLKNYGDQLQALGRESSQAFGDVEFQVLRAAAATSGSRDMVVEMTEESKRLAEQMGYFKSEEIARGMYFFASTTGSAVNSVEELSIMMGQLTPIMQAAAITQSDMEATIKGVYGILNQFSRPMEDAASVTEMLYYAAQKTAAELPDFVESLKMLGPVAAQAGVSFEDTLKALAILADNGIRGTMAGRAVRQMFLQLNDPAARATKALDGAVKSQLGLNKSFKQLVFPKGEFIGMAGYIRALAKVTANMNQEQKGNIIGVIATAAEVPALTKLIEAETEAMKRGTSAISDNTKGVGDATRARELFAQSVDLVAQSTKAALGRIDNAIQNIKATFGEALAPAIEDLSFRLADIAKRFDEFARANPELLKTVATLTVLAGVAMTAGGAILGLVGAILLVTRVAFKEIALLVGGVSKVGPAAAGAATAAEGMTSVAAGAINATRAMNPFTATFKFLSGLVTGLGNKIKAPFVALSGGAKASTGIMAGLGKTLSGFLGGITKFARFISITWQAFLTIAAGIFVGFFQAISGGKKETDALSGAVSVLGEVFKFVSGVVDVLTAGFGLLFEAARFVGIQLGKMFGPDGPLGFLPGLIGTVFGGIGDLLGHIGNAINTVTAEFKKLNDDSLDPNKEKLKEIELQIASLTEQSSRFYGAAAEDNAARIKQLENEKKYLEDLISSTSRTALEQEKRISQAKEIQTQIDVLTASIKSLRGEEKKAAEARISALNLERGKLLAIVEATRLANAERTYFLGGNQDIVAARERANQNLLNNNNNNNNNNGGGGEQKTAREKALELAQQAASLAEALYKIEGINLKELIRKTMGKVAEAMKLAIKLTAPYAKAFKTATLEKVGNFAGAVGSVASAVGGMVDAAEKLATYKSPSAANLKKIISDMSVAMKYMIAEAKKFAGSQVIAVEAYSAGAQAVVGSISAAVDAFNSMATGVYQPPERVLRQVAEDISKAVQAFVSKLSSAPTQPMLDKAKAFAEAANAVLGTIGSAISSFKDLRNYVKPLASDLQAVVNTIETAVRQMLVSMGRFSLNKDQWEVVNTFANVAKAIADAVGGTYDAFVKQMDFVDQFREEIDYDKVFGWIEDGIRKMADIASSMPVGMVAMARDAADAAKAIAEALEAFFNLAVNTGGDPALLADSLQGAVNSVLSIIEAFATTSQIVGAHFVDSLIVGMQSRESALAAEANRLTQIMSGAGTSITRQNNNTMTINHVVTDPNGVLKNASAQEVASLLSGDVFINNLVHSIKTQ